MTRPCDDRAAELILRAYSVGIHPDGAAAVLGVQLPERYQPWAGTGGYEICWFDAGKVRRIDQQTKKARSAPAGWWLVPVSSSSVAPRAEAVFSALLEAAADRSAAS